MTPRHGGFGYLGPVLDLNVLPHLGATPCYAPERLDSPTTTPIPSPSSVTGADALTCWVWIRPRSATHSVPWA
jgi:hypothetical protein